MHEQPKRDLVQRAELLYRRGVRRIFAVFVKLCRVAETSRTRSSRALGRRRGPAASPRGRREAVHQLCEALGVALTPRRRAALDRMAASDLGALAEQIARERRRG